MAGTNADMPRRHFLKTGAFVAGVGTLETPEFIRQSSDFAAALKAAGKPVQTVVAQQYNHFEIIETLANPLSPLGRAALQQMGLAQK